MSAWELQHQTRFRRRRTPHFGMPHQRKCKSWSPLNTFGKSVKWWTTLKPTLWQAIFPCLNEFITSSFLIVSSLPCSSYLLAFVTVKIWQASLGNRNVNSDWNFLSRQYMHDVLRLGISLSSHSPSHSSLLSFPHSTPPSIVYLMFGEQNTNKKQISMHIAYAYRVHARIRALKTFCCPNSDHI